MFKRIGMALLTLSLTTAIAGTGWAAPSPAQIDVSQTSFDFDTAKPNSDAEFHHGLLLAVQADGDLVYYDRTGKQAFVLPEGIVPVTDFAEQRAVVKDSATGRYGYINTKGIVAIPCQYASAGNLSGGVAHVVLAEGAGEALIDRAGKVVTTLTEKYSSEFYFSDGLALAYAPEGEDRIYQYFRQAGYSLSIHRSERILPRFGSCEEQCGVVRIYQYGGKNSDSV